MIYALSSGGTRRVSLLGIVVALHAGLLSIVLAAKSVAPSLLEAPLVVHLIDPPKSIELPKPMEIETQPKPLPALPPKREVKRVKTPRPKPVVQQSPPAVSPPQPAALETTASAQAAPASAPTAAAPASVATQPTENARVSGAAVGSGEEKTVGARFDADYLRNPAPPYPSLSRRLGEEGKVILRVLVSSDGSARLVEVKTSSGSARLDESAQKTVRQWKFIPAKRVDVAVDSWVLVPILFKLEQ